MKNFDPLAIAARNRAVFAEPPKLVPGGNVDVSGNGRWPMWKHTGTKIDAPLLGNGDMLAAFAGPPEWPQFWVTTNDFWQMESNPNYEFFHDGAVSKFDPSMSLGSPKPVGRFVFDIPAMRGASYEAAQDFLTATTSAVFVNGEGTRLELNAWVAAVENVLIVEFLASSELEVSAEFCFPDETGKGCDEGIDFTGTQETDESLHNSFAGLIGGQPVQYRKTDKKGMISGYREFRDKVDIATKAGFAGKFVGAGAPRVTLHAGEKLVFAVALRSWEKVSRPYEMACSRAGYINGADIAALREQHLMWWRDHWSVSAVMPGDSLVEQAYYLTQYALASLSRDALFPPNILGICTFDRMAWNGNYKINYNHQSPYLGLMAAGHFEQADAHDAPYLAMLDIGREMSARLLRHEGVYLPLGLGPKGMVSEALLLHMKSPAVHGALNMILRYKYTLDRAYAKRVYPFLKSVADFWEKDLIYRDGTYNIYADGMHEKTTGDVNRHGMPENPVNTLGYLKLFFLAMPEISRDLGLDGDRRGHWLEISGKLAAFPTSTVKEIGDKYPPYRGISLDLTEMLPAETHGLKVYLNEEKGSIWTLGFPANIMHIYPAGAVGLGSAPEELEVARNTVHVRSVQEKRLMQLNSDNSSSGVGRKVGAWNDGNLSCLFFPAAVRVGYDPEEIWKELRTRLAALVLPNGFIDGNPHGIENLSTPHNTVQEMMLLSHENIIRVFKVWPRAACPAAAFYKLWAFGGFQVSASLSNGEVDGVEIYVNADNLLRLENPWPGCKAEAERSPFGRRSVEEGEVLSLEVYKGERILFKRA